MLALSTPLVVGQRVSAYQTVGGIQSSFSPDAIVGARPGGADGARGLTTAQIAFWDAVLAAATACDAWKSAIAQHHWSALYRNSAELAAYLPRERARMRAVLVELGLLA